MFKRLMRWLRATFGGAVDSLEDPEKILQQNIRDLNDQIPVMNENIAMVKANVVLAQKQRDSLVEQERQLKGKIKAALLGEKRDMALNFATTLEQVQKDLAAANSNVEISEKAFEKAQRVKNAFMAERDRKIKEALRAISVAKQTEWQNRVAHTMQTFEVGSIDQTHDEMVRKIEERAAQSQARLELALDHVGAEEFELEKEAEKLQANETLRQFEIELGLVKPEALAAEKTLGPGEAVAATGQNAAPEGAKTMGRESVTQGS
ncbi:MAG: PspA/IM30 family protein [Deltaproteobacteria bacterium]|nr:PspA/IM30 family protein [Deltaproteobacteria bacterium]